MTVTLTTDCGTADPYVAAVKVRLLAQAPGTNIIDIGHDVTPFDLKNAAMLVRGVWALCPKGTVHIIGVEGNHVPEAYIAISFRGQYFLCSDNGVASLALGPALANEAECYQLPVEDAHQLLFPMLHVMAPAAARLLNGEPADALGDIWMHPVAMNEARPVLQEKSLSGEVVWVDVYGNAITNISGEDLDRYSHFREIRISHGLHDFFDSIGTWYGNAEPGEKVCFINSMGVLELAINKGSAADLLGLDIGSKILVEFSNGEGSALKLA